MAKEREIAVKLKEVLRRAKPDQSKIPALNQKNRRGDNIQINGDVIISQRGPFFIGQGGGNEAGEKSPVKSILKKVRLSAGSIVVLLIIPLVITIGGSTEKNSNLFPDGKISAIESVSPIPKLDIAINPVSLPADCHTYYNITVSIPGCSRCINTQNRQPPI